MTYADAIHFLYGLRWFGTKFGLSNTLKLAALAGNPQQKLRFIHVAGTNGKGSTCAMLESIYRAPGLRVGLFTSPHLVSFGERIQVNRRPISEAEVVAQIAGLQPLLQQFSAEEHPTFFEVVTVMALRYFAGQHCDLVIWETGLGGRLDSTNIVTPLASVITNVTFDHQRWLGETLAAIASEKAGIIKPHIPVLTAAIEPEALAVIQETARSKEAPFTLVSEIDTQQPPLSTIELPLLGHHQRLNAALAFATVRALSTRIAVEEEAIRTGLSKVSWPGRLQLVSRPSGGKVLLDGAHNIAGAEMLASALREYFPSIRPAFILGILEDKNWSSMCQVLAPLAKAIFVTPVSSERTAPPEQLRDACLKANKSADVVVCGSLAEALDKVVGEPFVVVTGSLYLVGEALELLGASPGSELGERGLNEWSTKSEPSHKPNSTK